MAPQRLHAAALGRHVAPRRGSHEVSVDGQPLGHPAAGGGVENADRLEDQQRSLAVGHDLPGEERPHPALRLLHSQRRRAEGPVDA